MAAPTLALCLPLLVLIVLFFLTLILQSLLPQLFASIWTRFMMASQSPFRRSNSKPKNWLLSSDYKEKFVVSCYKGEMSFKEEVECGVCICKISRGEEIRELRCEHLFHRHCLDGWCGYGNATCPICRRPLLPPLPGVDWKHGGTGKHRCPL
ncbi:RING-H2 finger protein ATL64-like [Aristolochia californica]|uniref:RING-H2 finger protein ATL64-like n=1 Tax=Aristolochia californica TaxID=171875 RepID=UPI0035D8CEED